MKVLQSSFFRAIIAIIVGTLLIRYREETATWLTILIGVLFFLSGVISCTVYYSQKKRAGDTVVYDAQGNQPGCGPISPSWDWEALSWV